VQLSRCRRQVDTMHFVGFCAMALTAELRCRVAGGVAWVIGTLHEEAGLVVAGYAIDRSLVDDHAVLIVAGRAGDHGLSVVSNGAPGEAIICLKLGELAARRSGELSSCADGAIPVIGSAATNESDRSHRVIVLVVALGACVVAEQGRGVAAD